jgi:hypothetical protein
VVVVVAVVSLVIVPGTTFVCVVVEVTDTTGAAPVTVTMIVLVPVATAEQAAEMREDDHVDTEAGTCMARFALLAKASVSSSEGGSKTVAVSVVL